MKISLNWMKDYVSLGVSVEALVKRLTMAGIEAEKIETVGSDTVVEFEITPNRPDCLSMIGMAREISVALDKPLTIPKIQRRVISSKKCAVTVLASQACPRYIGTVIEGVQIKPADKKMQDRISALGSRPICNIVDVTNFCLFETGQPLHAFDLDKLKGREIVVRFARAGEKIVTLDGVERALDPSVLVIADAEKPVALAGIMGGANSEVTSGTKNILLESAYFDPVLIRRTARKLGLSSDASYRFERGVVFDNVAFGAARAVDLILEQAGGKETAQKDVAGSNPIRSKKVFLNFAKQDAFLGAKIPVAQTKKILKALGFTFSAGKTGTLSVTPPAFRPDVVRPEDLYEEIARGLGYDRLPSSFPTVKLTGIGSNVHRAKRLKVTDYLLSQGFNEVLTYSLISQDQAEKARVNGFSGMKVLNPLSKEQELLRSHLLPSLLQVVYTNANHGQKDLAVFETGKVYPESGESEVLGIALTGKLRCDWRQADHAPFDFYDIKGAVERVLWQMNIQGVSFSVSEEVFLEKGQRADIFCGKVRIGSCGKVADEVVAGFGIKNQVVFFAQLDLEALYRLPQKAVKYVPIGEFPSIVRDVSIAADRKVSFGEICAVVREFGGEHLKKIDFKEEYLGEKIPQGQRGLVFSVCYQSSKCTLTEEEIQAVHDAVCQKLQERLGAVIR